MGSFCHHSPAWNRREFLRTTAAGVLGAGMVPHAGLGQVSIATASRPKVAVVFTEFWYRSHAHVLVENFLNPYLFNGEPTDPGCDVVSFYGDHFPANDMSRDVAREYGIPIFPTIAEALTIGGESLAVDAVLAIGEHGDYPTNEKGQVEYPRKRFFDEITAVFRSSGRSTPVYNDKHLSYRWDWAKEMYDTSRALGFPFMAGSSVPLAQRRPPLEVPVGTAMRSAVSIHGGPVESYDFHGLEVLQSIVEARKGGEKGVTRVQFLVGDALWNAARAGAWSVDLADAAMAAELGPDRPTIRRLVESGQLGGSPPHGILLDYVDGFRAIVLRIGESSTRWNFACELEGPSEPVATSFHVGPWDNRNLFKALRTPFNGVSESERPPTRSSARC